MREGLFFDMTAFLGASRNIVWKNQEAVIHKRE